MRPELLLERDPGEVGGDRRPGRTAESRISRQTFLAVAGLMAAAFVALRLWALAPSWFYADDHRLLGQAQQSELGIGYLTEPFDSQFMPFGRAVAWWVSHDLRGNVVQPSWSLAVTISLVLAVAAAATCLWMLVVAFGPRWEVLLLYGLALTSTTALPGSMWWAASLNQLPLLVAWAGAVAATLRYLQTTRKVWIVAVLGFLVFGLLAYVKTVVVVVVLAYLALAYFARGTLRDRVVTLVGRHRAAVAAVGVLVVGFGCYYVLAVPSVVSDSSISGTAGPLADRLVGTSWAAAAVGGPWRWNDGNAPVSITDPPDWAVHLSWVAIAMIVLYAALRRTGTGRGWGLVGLGLLMDYGILLVTRGPAFGAIAGNEMRYLTESSLYVALGTGLVFLPLLHADRPSRERVDPLLRVRLAPAAPVVAVVLIVLGGLASTYRYVGTWHDDNPGRSYIDAVAQAVRNEGRLDLADTVVPEQVMSPVLAPYNTASTLLPLHVPRLDFPAVSDRLFVLGEDGHPTPASIDPATTSVPGRIAGCGWRITSTTRTIPLNQATIDYDWWLRIGYLSSQRSPLTVQAGEVSRTAVVNPGLGSLFVHVSGAFESITLSGLDDDTTLCVDVVEVGVPRSGDGS